ncbi:MAG: MFS transporter [Pseudomonadota bacterium]
MSDTADATGSASPFAPLTVPTFRAVWIGNLLSNFGGLVQAVGAAWLMTLIATTDTQVALVAATTTLPVMLFSLLSGAVADSYDRRRVMLCAQLFMFAVSIVLVAVTWAGWINAWSLLGLTFLIGCGVAFNNPAWQASVRDFVGMELLPRAVLLNGVGFNVTRSVAPAVGGAIVASAGAVAAFAVNALSYLGIIFAVWRWRGVDADRDRAPEPLTAAMVAGIRYVRLSPKLLRLCTRGFLFGLGAVVVLAMLPLVTRDLLQGTSLRYGLLLGAFGLGAVISGVSSARMTQRLRSEQLMQVSFAALALSALLISVSPWFPLSLLATAIAGWAWVLALALINTTVQMSTPRWVVGRAMAFYQMFTFGGMALGAWIWGLIAESDGVAQALQWAALALGVGLLVGLRWPIPSQEDLQLDPLGRWQEPAIGLAIEPRSGPVVVSVTHEIREADTTEFAHWMRERRRIRERDGALRWTLLRDLEAPQRWTERFEFPTWADYVRFHSRTTQEDGKVTDRIHALHQGAGVPAVQRDLIRDPGKLEQEIAPRGAPEI